MSIPYLVLKQGQNILWFWVSLQTDSASWSPNKTQYIFQHIAVFTLIMYYVSSILTNYKSCQQVNNFALPFLSRSPNAKWSCCWGEGFQFKGSLYKKTEILNFVSTNGSHPQLCNELFKPSFVYVKSYRTYVR